MRAWLDRHPDWLLAFDNAEDPAAVQPFLPRFRRGHVLITSRNPDWGHVGAALPVPTLPPPKSAEFLLRRSGQADRASATPLASELGDLPLALEQAGAYLARTGTSLRAYLDLFRTRHAELLAEGCGSDEHPATVAATFRLAIEQVEADPNADARAGVDLLNLCAFLAPDQIPLSILEQGREHLPSQLADVVADAIRLNRALEALRRYALVERIGETLSLHRLVQAVARDRLGQERDTWAQAALEALDEVLPGPPNDPKHWPTLEVLTPHVATVTALIDDAHHISPTAARLLNQLGWYLTERAQFATARNHVERALRIDEAALGPDHPSVAVRLSNLGTVLRDLGDLAGARALFERALRIAEAALGPDHPTTRTIRAKLEPFGLQGS